MTSRPSRVSSSRVRAAVLVALAVAAAGAGAAPAAAQLDTLRADTLQADSLRADTAVVGPDTLRVEEGVPDSLRVDTLMSMPGGAPVGFGPGVWVFTREDLLSTRAVSLVDLLTQVPGVIPLRGGDYGTPRSATAFGLGGGRIRVFWDGFEVLPLDGAVVDLARVGLAGLESVRVERGTAEIRIELESLKVVDPRPMSVVEAATGDFDTNLFRGTFVHPRALGGNVGVAIERLDTRGPRGAETGSQSGFWLRYTLLRGERFGVRGEIRQGRAESEVPLFPSQVTRRDWTVRARGRLAEGLVGELFTGRASVEGGEDDGLTPVDQTRGQHGARLAFEGGPLWARGSFRLLTGADLPSNALEVEGGLTSAAFGGVAAGLSRESWAGETASLASLRAWTRPVLGVAPFVSWQWGTRGARIFQPRVPIPDPSEEPEDGEEPPDPEPDPEPAPPAFRVTDRTGMRVGAAGAWGPLTLSAAWLRLEADSLVPLNILVDREGYAAPGGEWTGFEVAGKLGLPVSGFGLYGSLQQWDGEGRYLPERVYAGGIDFHEVFMASGNLELWGSLGVQGRDPMLVALPEEGWEPPTEPDASPGPVPLARVPFLQTWHAFIQVRIVTVRAFIHWENFTIRRERQDFPDRLQPVTRASYGIRWTLWN